MQIITSQVAENSTIWTDEHRSYKILSDIDYNHKTVCHKYKFVSNLGINTQSVEF
jgi:hypothetical protein